MLTLQNDPPNLDSVSEEKDQYKNYGKSFRKMICDCLQKDPTKRPTATELLKNSFLRKAKDKKYLVQTLLSSAPSIEERAKKAKNVKRPPGTSGRLHRTEAGDWVWSSDDDLSDSNEQKDSSASSSSVCSGNQANTSNNNSNTNSSNPVGNGNSNTATTTTTTTTSTTNNNNSSQTNVKVDQLSSTEVPSSNSNQGQQFGSDTNGNNHQPISPPTINLVLRIRNSQKDLNDIRFEYSSDRGKLIFSIKRTRKKDQTNLITTFNANSFFFIIYHQYRHG